MRFKWKEPINMNIEDRLRALEAKVQELSDRQAILDCIKRNSRGNDRFDVDLVTSSYCPDGIHELGQKQIPGREYGEHANRAHGALFDANLHNVTMHVCEIHGDVAHAESYSVGIFLEKGGETGRILAGRYIDRLERRDGEWRIALRRSTVEIAIEGKALLPNGKPLPGSGYLKGNRDLGDPSYERPLTTASGARW
jgi:ketosteroid isomerase-like protein